MVKLRYQINSEAMSPEIKIDPRSVPEFKRHFVFDDENPLQRKIIPVHTILKLLDVVEKHENYINESKNQSKNPPKFDLYECPYSKI